MHGVDLIHATPFNLLWLIPALPLLGAAINGLFGLKLMRKFGPRINHLVAIVLPTVSFVITVLAFIELQGLDEHARALRQIVFPFIHIGLFDADLSFWFDPLSAVMTLVVTAVGTLIHVYSIGYMAGDEGYWRFFAYMNLFLASMLTLVLGDNFLVMFIGWEGVGLCSYLLIAFWYKEKANAVAGMKAFIVNRIGDFGFVIGTALLFWGLTGDYSGRPFVDDAYRSSDFGVAKVTDYEKAELCVQYGGCPVHRLPGTPENITIGGSLEQRFKDHGRPPPTSLRFDAVRARIEQEHTRWAESSLKAKRLTLWDFSIGDSRFTLTVPLVVLICLFLFLGATGKSAQIPLYVWLPDAMAGPTPVSALIHAATMVTAGVYMVARTSFLYSLSPTAMTVVAVVAAITALYAATIGLFQYDIKKVLAYSTVSQLGYMFIGVGVGAYWAGIYHLVTHAVFKALLFLGSGSVILGCHHQQDMRKMGGLKKYMPLTHWTYWFACIAITTAPFFLISNGFFSKDEILWKAFDAEHLLIPGGLIWLVGFVGAGLTAFYMWRSYYMTFTGEYRGGDDDHGHGEHGHGGAPHESPRTMTWVLVTLAALIIPTAILGFWPLVGIDALFEHWLHPVTGAARESLVWLSNSHEALVAGLSAHTWEYLLAGASILISLAGWQSARALYKDQKSEAPGRLLASQSRWIRAPHTLIYNKYFVDEAYDWLIVRRTRQLSRALFWFDQKIIDGLVNLCGFCGRLISALDGLIDALVVDGLVNGIAQAIAAAGRQVRRLQTGHIQTYLAGVIIGALLLVLINFFLFL